MSYQVTNDDIRLLLQGEQEVFLKIELLNSNFKVLESVEGKTLTDSFSQTNDSNQRRSYSFTIVVTDSSFLIGKDKKIWLDKRLRIYYGIKSLRTHTPVWYKLGVFAYINASYNYNTSAKELSLTCADLMSLYDGTLNGKLSGYGSSNTDSTIAATGLKIPAGEDIRQSVIALIKDAEIKNYIVEDIGKEIPYDLEFSTGVTYCDVWKEICELYDSWEFFFDVDGTFVWRKIPTCFDDPVILDESVMDVITSDEKVDIDFSQIYNVTEVWGKILELDDEDRYADISTYTDNTYHITLSFYSSWDDIDDLTQIGFKVCSDNQNSPKFSINGYSSIDIVDGNGDVLTEGMLKANTIYVFRYRRILNSDATYTPKLYLLGQYQCRGRYAETSIECPFSVTNLGYEIVNSVDYNNLSDDAACYNQAEYLTYKSTAMMDSITLTTIAIPWLEVNQKIKYTSKSTGKTDQYIVKSLSWSTGSTMSLTLYKFLEDFSFVYNRKNSKSKIKQQV